MMLTSSFGYDYCNRRVYWYFMFHLRSAPFDRVCAILKGQRPFFRHCDTKPSDPYSPKIQLEPTSLQIGIHGRIRREATENKDSGRDVLTGLAHEEFDSGGFETMNTSQVNHYELIKVRQSSS